MAGFTIYITPVITDDDVNHIATSWQVATDPSFSSDSLLVDKEKDEDNLLSLYVDLPLTKDNIYYTRHKLHFDDNSETDWSRPAVITKDGDGFSFNNTIITTPKVFSEAGNTNTPLGGFKIYTDEYRLFMGVGEHLSTDWIVEDSEGNIVWQRLEDKSNKTEIKLPANILKPGKLYLIKVRFRSDTNAWSNFGRLLIITDSSLVSDCTGTVDNEQLLFLQQQIDELTKERDDLFEKLVAATIANNVYINQCDTENNES